MKRPALILTGALTLALAAGAALAADLMVSQTGGGTATMGQTRTLVVTASSVSLPLPPNLTKRVTVTLSPGLGQIAASGPGWTCPVSGQVVTCTRTTALASGAAFPAITITALVGTGATWSSCAVVSHDVNAAVQPDQVAANNTACVGGAIRMRPR